MGQDGLEIYRVDMLRTKKILECNVRMVTVSQIMYFTFGSATGIQIHPFSHSLNNPRNT